MNCSTGVYRKKDDYKPMEAFIFPYSNSYYKVSKFAIWNKAKNALSSSTRFLSD